MDGNGAAEQGFVRRSTGERLTAGQAEVGDGQSIDGNVAAEPGLVCRSTGERLTAGQAAVGNGPSSDGLWPRNEVLCVGRLESG